MVYPIIEAMNKRYIIFQQNIFNKQVLVVTNLYGWLYWHTLQIVHLSNKTRDVYIFLKKEYVYTNAIVNWVTWYNKITCTLNLVCQ